METFIAKKNSKKYDFIKGDSFPVYRSIMGECIAIRSTPKMNIIISERKLRSYGSLTGEPYIFDVGSLSEVRRTYGS